MISDKQYKCNKKKDSNNIILKTKNKEAKIDNTKL